MDAARFERAGKWPAPIPVVERSGCAETNAGDEVLRGEVRGVLPLPAAQPGGTVPSGFTTAGGGGSGEAVCIISACER